MILRRGPAARSNCAAPTARHPNQAALWRGWLHRAPNAEGDTSGQSAQPLLALSAAVVPCNVEAER